MAYDPASHWRCIVSGSVREQESSTNDLDHLARLAAGGDRAALDELLGKIRPTVLRRCGSMLLYRADAEEACQDVLLKIFKGIHHFDGRSAFTTWLYPVVTNCVRDTYRRLRRQAEAAPVEEHAQRPDPRTTSVIAGARIDLLDALEKLEQQSADLVQPFVLRDIFDLEYATISEQLDVPVSTVRFRTHEARKFIRVRLER
jgi:RNA polymerase sigma-70 factor, ECF subfamily